MCSDLETALDSLAYRTAVIRAFEVAPNVTVFTTNG
jgi:hypothetical protein